MSCTSRRSRLGYTLVWDARVGPQHTRGVSPARLTRITGLLIVRRSLQCGGDTERGHSAQDNETAE